MASLKTRIEALERRKQRQRARGPTPIYNVKRSELEAFRAAHPAPTDWQPGDAPRMVIVVRSDAR